MYFVSRPMKIVTFLSKNGYLPKRVVDFPRERDTLLNKIMEIVEDSDEQSYNNNGKPWKSNRILRLNPFSFFFLFSPFFRFFPFFHFLIFSCFSFSLFIFSEEKCFFFPFFLYFFQICFIAGISIRV